jgi:hypothetical protein
MKIRIAIVDSRIGEDMERALTLCGFRVITLPRFSALSEAVSSHTDMLICRIGNEYISYADYCDEAAYVFADLSLLLAPSGAKFSFTADVVSAQYPNDCRLNALKMGDKLYCRKDSASEYMLERAEASGYTVVPSKQGYPACTVLKLNEESAITADRGMAKLLSEHGVRVTLIENGGIELPPHEYGFIGGAGGVFDGVLYLFGSPDRHPSGSIIIQTAEREGLRIVTLCDAPLCDLGGILFAECDIH